MYDLAALEAALAGTVFAGKLHFSSCNRIDELRCAGGARNGAPHGSVFFADEQTAGRGRGDHTGTPLRAGALRERAAARRSCRRRACPLLPLGRGTCCSRGDPVDAADSQSICAGPTIC